MINQDYVSPKDSFVSGVVVEGCETRPYRRAITRTGVPIVGPAAVGNAWSEVRVSNAHNRTEIAVNPHRAISSLIVIAGTALLLAGCGGGSSPSASAKPSTSSSQTRGGSAVEISNFKFLPASITVKQGAGVTVTNQDSTAHTATSDNGKSFDTGTLDPGASHAISVSKPGTYAYHCSIHPFMHGTLVIK